MPFIDAEEIVGWYDKNKNRFLCYRCTPKNLKELEDYSVIQESDLQELQLAGGGLFVCDKCGKKFC